MSIAVAGATGLVGRLLTRVLQERGHAVVQLSRASGANLLTDDRLAKRFAGVSTVIDVTDSPDPSEKAATAFFTAATTNLGAAAAQGGVAHFLVLSIVGTDLIPGGYYAAKLAQEAAARRAFGLGTVVLRATQFHEFAEQSLGWGLEGNRCLVPGMPVQPIALRAVVDELAIRASRAGHDGEIGGPRREFLPDMVRRLIARTGHPIDVVPQEVEPPVRDGALLPGPNAAISGPTFDEWLAAR